MWDTKIMKWEMFVFASFFLKMIMFENTMTNFTCFGDFCLNQTVYEKSKTTQKWAGTECYIGRRQMP